MKNLQAKKWERKENKNSFLFEKCSFFIPNQYETFSPTHLNDKEILLRLNFLEQKSWLRFFHAKCCVMHLFFFLLCCLFHILEKKVRPNFFDVVLIVVSCRRKNKCIAPELDGCKVKVFMFHAKAQTAITQSSGFLVVGLKSPSRQPSTTVPL